jgi:signal transduction histidine kinase
MIQPVRSFDRSDMTVPEKKITEQLDILASHLAGRREALLAAWEEAVEGDPELAGVALISRAQFRDLMPTVLARFEEKLRRAGRCRDDMQQEQEERAVEHGVHRWAQGYSLQGLVREWNHFQLSLLDELERYGLAHPDLEPDVMPTARRLWAEICGQGITESVVQFAQLQQIEAAGRLRDLEMALEKLKDGDRQRAESWREAAHDLRGNVGIVTTTTSLLTGDGVPEPLRVKAAGILQSSVTSLQHLLEDLMSLARLEAGHETRKSEAFDAAHLLSSMVDSLQPLAHERGLTLVADGPPTLLVESDPVKIQRIVQNLAINSLRYTERGEVRVRWAETRETDVERWLIRVEDTGPGLHHAPGAPIAHKLEEATESSRDVEEKGKALSGVEPVPGSSPPVPSPYQQPGEGIGLSIVKRLCELLEASLEVATEPGKGTIFQVTLPRRQSPGSPDL